MQHQRALLHLPTTVAFLPRGCNSPFHVLLQRTDRTHLRRCCGRGRRAVMLRLQHENEGKTVQRH